jgi:hypothetical protein
MQEAEARQAGLRLLRFEQPFHLEQLHGGLNPADLLPELGAGGAGAKMTTSTVLFHSDLLNISDISECQDKDYKNHCLQSKRHGKSFLIVKTEPHVKSWEEPQYNIQNLAIEEEYGFGVLNEGQAIAIARNIKLRPNELVTPARSVISIGSDNTLYEETNNLMGVATPIDVLADREGVTPPPGAFVETLS